MSKSVMGLRKVRVVSDGKARNSKLLDAETGEDLTETYAIGRIVVSIDAQGVFANVCFQCDSVDVQGFLEGARTQSEQKAIVETAESISDPTGGFPRVASAIVDPPPHGTLPDFGTNGGRS